MAGDRGRIRNGPTAAGLGAAALGAVRASRRAGGQLEDALALMDDTVRRLEHRDFYVTAIVARWRAATATLRWVNCGHPPAYLIDLDGDLHKLTGVDHPALGAEKPDRAYRASERQLHSGERLVLITDGITERHVEEGGRFGLDGLHAASQARNIPPLPPQRWPSTPRSPPGGPNRSKMTPPWS